MSKALTVQHFTLFEQGPFWFFALLPVRERFYFLAFKHRLASAKFQRPLRALAHMFTHTFGKKRGTGFKVDIDVNNANNA